ncbi:MAG: lipid asymmetry maintenance ABC transporter permease subunit MlaE [Neisseriaceae bacterium]|nr:MAG: lipid asymmetry maintenance ABC transporter permease subunit MlaE [Neisseriaceae bacterium]
MNKIISFIAKIGNPVTSFIIMLGAMFMLILQIIASIPYCLRRFHLVIKELFFSGVLSLVIISVSGWFVGMVLALQGYNTLQRFGSVSVLGSLVALSLLRELGPVLSAILFASRAGSGITAGIGLMKATEQLDAMQVMSVNPVSKVFAPKLLAGIIAVPILNVLFNTCGILGGHFVGVTLLGLNNGAFWSQMQDSVSFNYDIINSIIKSFIFGICITLLAVFHGVTSKATAEGISSATTKTVVHSALAVLALDFILTAFMF